MQKEDIKKKVAKGKQKLSEEASALQQAVKEAEANVEEKLENNIIKINCFQGDSHLCFMLTGTC